MAGFDIENLKEQQFEALKRLQNGTKKPTEIFDTKIELDSNIFEDSIESLNKSDDTSIQILNQQLQNSGYNIEDIYTILDTNQDGKLDYNEINYLKEFNKDEKFTSDDFEKFIEEATSTEIQEAILNIELENISVQQLNEMAEKYTQRTNLTLQDYEQIIAINQIENIFGDAYTQYLNQNSSEGFIDNTYNYLKDLFDLGITREMVENEFNSHFNTIKALSSFVDRDYATTNEVLKEEFIRKVNQESNGNIIEQFYTFVEYYEDEDTAIEKFNEFTSKSREENTPEISISKSENGELLINIGESEPQKLDDLIDFSSNPLLIFNYKLDEAKITDENYFNTTIGTDFNSTYKFLNGVEYNAENIEDFIQKNYLYTSANAGYYTAMELQNSLSEKSLEDTFEQFLILNDNDTQSAIEQFNNYYNSILNEEDTEGIITNQIGENSTIRSINARLNDEGEIEYVIGIEANNQNDYILDYLGEYTEKNGLREFIYNPSKLEDLSENQNNNEFIQYSNLSNTFENIFYQINQDVKLNNILTNRFEKSFEETNGLSLEEVYEQYFESYNLAIGDSELQNTLSNYINDMDSYADKLSMIISMGSIGLSFIFPPAGIGALVGAGIDNTIDGINILTNSKEDDWKSWLEETAYEAAMIAVGMGIGKASSQLGSKIKDLLLNKKISLKSASIMGTIVETGADVGLSIATDYITTGDINLSGNGLAGLLDIISGIRGYKAIASRYSSDVSIETTKPDAQDLTPAKDVAFESSQGIVETTDIQTTRPDTFDSSLASDISFESSQGIVETTDIQTTRPDTFDSSLASDISFESSAKATNIPDTYEYYARKTFNEALEKARKKGITITPEKLAAAEDIIARGATYEHTLELASELAQEHASGTYTLDTLEEIAKCFDIKINGDISKNSDGIYIAQSGTATISGRAKSVDSTFSKLKNKILEFKIDAPTSIAEARAAVGDSQGIRIVINESELTPDTLSKLNIEGLNTASDLDFMCRYLQGDTSNIPQDKITYFQGIENEVIGALAELQTQGFVDKLCESIINEDIIISEINNYSGANGIPYLSAGQVEQIQKAYEVLYQKIYNFTKKHPEISQYEIRVDSHGEEYLFDSISQSEFKSTIPTKSATITTNDSGIKKSGYTGAQFNVVNSYNQQTELQFRSSVLNKIAETEHIIYDIINDKETVSDPIYDDLKEVIEKIRNIDKLNKNSDLLNEFYSYYNEIYISGRKQELGINAEFPNVESYTGLSSNLSQEELYIMSLDGVMDLHTRVEKMKHENKK